MDHTRYFGIGMTLAGITVGLLFVLDFLRYRRKKAKIRNNSQRRYYLVTGTHRPLSFYISQQKLHNAHLHMINETNSILQREQNNSKRILPGILGDKSKNKKRKKRIVKQYSDSGEDMNNRNIKRKSKKSKKNIEKPPEKLEMCFQHSNILTIDKLDDARSTNGQSKCRKQPGEKIGTYYSKNEMKESTEDEVDHKQRLAVRDNLLEDNNDLFNEKLFLKESKMKLKQRELFCLKSGLLPADLTREKSKSSDEYSEEIKQHCDHHQTTKPPQYSTENFHRVNSLSDRVANNSQSLHDAESLRMGHNGIQPMPGVSLHSKILGKHAVGPPATVKSIGQVPRPLPRLPIQFEKPDEYDLQVHM